MNFLSNIYSGVSNLISKAIDLIWDRGIQDVEQPIENVFEEIKEIFEDVIWKRTLIDKIGFVTRSDYEQTSGIHSIENLYEGISQSVKDNQEEEMIPGQVVLFWKQPNNKILYRTIQFNEYNTFNTFMKTINEFVDSGKLAPGSDKLEVIQSDLILDRFDLISTKIIGLGGKINFPIFRVENIKVENNELCGNACVRELLGFYPEMELKTIEDFTEFGKEYPINIINNYFMPTKEYYSEFSNYLKDDYTETFIYKGSKFYKVKDNHIKYPCVEHPYRVIMYCGQSEHFDICYPHESQLYFNLKGHYITKQDGILSDIYMPTQMRDLHNKNDITKTHTDIKYIFFDFETVINWNMSSKMEAYSIAFLVADEHLLDELNKADYENSDRSLGFIKNIIAGPTHYFSGPDCIGNFYNSIIYNQADTVFRLVSFNGSYFDNIILLDWLLNNNCDNISDIVYVNNSVFNFKLSGRHETFDLAKHLVGSLSTLCKSFQVNTVAKKSLDHQYFQDLFEEDKEKFYEYIKNDEELINYNKYDVLSLAVIYTRYQKALLDTGIDEIEDLGKDLFHIKTIGSLSYKAFLKSTEKSKIKLPCFYSNNKEKNDRYYKYYTDLQKYRVAGRCDLFNGKQTVKEPCASLDVCSMYPYQMCAAPVYYGVGDIIESSYEEYLSAKEINVNLIGFFYTTINQSPLIDNDWPLIYPEKEKNGNNWNTNNVLERYLISTVMIDGLRHYGALIEIHEGFYFKEAILSTKLFPTIAGLMKGKNEQDTLKRNKDPEYNNTLRETYKLCMNALSGKVIEKLHVDTTSVISGANEFLKLKDSRKVSNVKPVNIVGNRIIVQYSKEEINMMKKSRPISLAIQIYDYSKMYLYDTFISKIPRDQIFYSDTDSIKVTERAMDDWINNYASKNLVPHTNEIAQIDNRYLTHHIYERNSKIFGSIENEYEPIKISGILRTNNLNIFLAKKFYVSLYEHEGVKYLLKDRLKGVRDNDVYITELQANDYRSKTNKELHTIYNSSENKLKMIRCNEECNHPSDELCPNYNLSKLGFGKLIDDLNIRGYAYVICRSFKKSIKSYARSCELNQSNKFNTNSNSILMNYLIKKITV